MKKYMKKKKNQIRHFCLDYYYDGPDFDNH